MMRHISMFKSEVVGLDVCQLTCVILSCFAELLIQVGHHYWSIACNLFEPVILQLLSVGC